MDKTLDYILECGSYATPVIQQSTFTERRGVDFAYLRQNGFFFENGRLAKSIPVFGEPVPVYEDRFTHEYYYWDSGERVIVDAGLLTMFDLSFLPLATLLGVTYHCGSRTTEIVSNALWELGVPESGGSGVFMARNIGTNETVQNRIADLPEDATVLWFGKRPTRKVSDARLFQLADYLLWDNGRIIHKTLMPPALAGTGVTYQNAMLLRGDFWEIWFDGKGPTLLESRLNGCQYIARMIRKAGQDMKPLEIAPPASLPDDAPVDPEERKQYLQGVDGSLPAYSEDEIRDLRKSLAETCAKKTKAENAGDTAEAERLQEIINQFEEHIKKNTRPGGKSVLASNPMGNVKRGIRSAIDIVYKRLEDDKHRREDIAEHFRACIDIGDDCGYKDASRNWTIRD